MKKVNVMKILCGILMVVMLVNTFGWIALATAYISANFEAGTIGTTVTNYEGFKLTDSANSTYTSDGTITFAGDPDETPVEGIYQNKVASFKRSDCRDEGTGGYRSSQVFLENALTTAIDDGYVRFKFRLRSDDKYGNVFLMQTRNSGNTALPMNINFQEGTVTTSGGTGYFRSDNTKAVVPLNTWYNFELVSDLTGTNAKISVFINGRCILYQITPSIDAGSIKTIQLGTNRTVGAKVNDGTSNTPTANFSLDDFVMETITAQVYNDALGIPPANVLIRETFESIPGVAATIGNTLNNWHGWTLSSTSTTTNGSMTIAGDPDQTPVDNIYANQVALIARTNCPSDTQQLLQKTFTTTLEEGYVNLRFRLRSDDVYGKVFMVNIKDSEAHTWAMYIDFQDGKLIFSKLTPTELNPTNSENLQIPLPLNGQGTILNTWYNFEFIFDLTSTTIGKMTAYLNGTKVADRVDSGYSSSGYYFNNGSISTIQLGTNRQTGAMVNDGSGNTPTAKFYLDDIEMMMLTKAESLHTTDIIGITYSGNTITGINIKNERMPDVNKKVLVAVYETVGGNDVLKGAAVCSTDTGLGNLVLPVDNSLSAQNGNKIKAFLWDIEILAPFGEFYETLKY